MNAKLKEESHLQREAEKLKASLATELFTLRDRMDKAKADVVEEFRASQTFTDACSVYCGDGFEDCLEQVRSAYLDPDLSKITLDDLVPTTTRGDETVNEESDDSVHTGEQGPKDDGVVITQLVPVGTIAPLVPSAEDPSAQSVVDPSALDAPLVSSAKDPLAQNAMNPSALDAPPS